MKVLFLHSNTPDYLAESLFHGLRTLLGGNCVDVPRYDSMYAPLTDRFRSKLRGYGFTLYGLLEDIPELAEDRYFWQEEIDSYDIIVIANIWRQEEQLWKLQSFVRSEKIVILDGEDTPSLFPWANNKWRLRKKYWSYLLDIYNCKCFKRELIGKGYSYRLNGFLHRLLRKSVPFRQNLYPISFSIPEDKICEGDVNYKTKDFPAHIVDPEVAVHVLGSSKQYVFSSEAEYYEDLRRSRFGITTKRGGWDCLRHYELAASGCILCFKDYDLKPTTCAPHGLDESNCIIYHHFKELHEKIFSITEDEYEKLQKNTYKWIKSNTTITRAKWFLRACGLY